MGIGRWIFCAFHAVLANHHFHHSSFSAWVPELYIKINKAWTRLTSIFPSWLLVVLSGVLSQALLTFMHRNDHKKAPKPVEGKTEDAAAVVEVETVPEKQSVEVKTPQKKAQAKTAKTKKGK